MPTDWIVPDWPAPREVGALLTTRNGGTSGGSFGAGPGQPAGGMNLREGDGEDPGAVAANRAKLAAWLPSAPVWMRQVHGIEVFEAAAPSKAASAPLADAAFTRSRGVVLAIQTADCMPVLFCDRQARVVAAAHAGWRGLSAGILERTVAKLACEPEDVLAYLGPAIGPSAFEVGSDVLEAFCATLPGAKSAFVPGRPGKWFADLEALASLALRRLGITQIHSAGRCTLSEPEHFYSFRRDRVTGRMAALIWLK
jgi:YfiH family protein